MRASAELFDRQVKARSLAYVFAAGALLGLLTLAFPHDPAMDEPRLIALAGVALAVAVVYYARAAHVASWHLHAGVALGTVIITLANHYAGASALYPIMYSWPVLYAFYFFRLRDALAHLGLVAVAYAILLSTQEPMSPVVRWLLAVGTPAVIGPMISNLLGRLRVEAARAARQTHALSESEARTRRILESAHDAFVSIDRDGVVTDWNTAAERMFGWSAAEAVGQQLNELVHPPEGRAAHDERRELLLSGPEGPNRRFEVEYRRRDGSRFPAELTASRVRVGDDVLISAFVRDLSEREHLEQERAALLQEQVARLEAERVADMVGRTQELVDAALAHRNLRDILADLMPRVRRVLGAYAAAVFLAEDGDQLVLRHSRGGRPAAGSRSVPFGEGFAGRVAAEGKPMLVHDPPREDLLDPALEGQPIGSLIGVPLLARGKVTGVIQAAGESRRRFSDEDLSLLRLASDRVALAIDHARVYEREHHIAETLQRSLLPDHLPKLPGLAVAARYLPAAAEAEVGGDWYDVIPLPGGAVGLVMGDVAGKGLAAASMVGRLRSALRAYALEGHDPKTVVSRLNRLLWSELEESQMATLIYIVLDPAEDTLRWVNAGHMPPLLVVGDGLVHFLEGPHSVPLGVFPFPNFDELSMKLEPGATILLYTDGLVERPGDHIDDGLARLADAVRLTTPVPDELCDHLLDTLVQEGGATDDVALLALSNPPMSDRIEMQLPTEPEALSSMRGLLRRWLRHAEGSDQEIAEITTACGEAANNAIEHAGVDGTPFQVVGQLDGNEIAITVRDHGSWQGPRDGDQGRGLSLMRALMDEVELTPGPDGTTVRLSRRLNGGRE